LGCFAHTLNLVAQAALKPIHDAVADIKEIVTYFKRSTVGLNKLKTTIAEKGLQDLKLLQDCPTRWNSTFLMLQRFVLLKDAVLSALVLLTADAPPIPSVHKLKVIQECLPYLEPLYIMTKEMEGEKQVTVSKVLPMLRNDIKKSVSATDFSFKTTETQELVKTLKNELERRSVKRRTKLSVKPHF